MFDSYFYGQWVLGRIVSHLRFKYRQSITVDRFFQVVESWLMQYQVESNLRPEVFWKSFVMYFNREMTPEEEQKWYKIYEKETSSIQKDQREIIQGS